MAEEDERNTRQSHELEREIDDLKVKINTTETRLMMIKDVYAEIVSKLHKKQEEERKAEEERLRREVAVIRIQRWYRYRRMMRACRNKKKKKTKRKQRKQSSSGDMAVSVKVGKKRSDASIIEDDEAGDLREKEQAKQSRNKSSETESLNNASSAQKSKSPKDKRPIKRIIVEKIKPVPEVSEEIEPQVETLNQASQTDNRVPQSRMIY